MLNTNTRRIIAERHHGWEQATPGLLAAVFDLTPQAVTAICRDRCAACGEPVCDHPDAVFAGIVPGVR